MLPMHTNSTFVIMSQSVRENPGKFKYFYKGNGVDFYSFYILINPLHKISNKVLDIHKNYA